MKRIVIILSIVVVFVMCMVQISNVSAKTGPIPRYKIYTNGWIRLIDNELQKIVVETKYLLWPDNTPDYFGFFVTESTEITIGGEPGDFEDLELGQYITYSYIQEDLFSPCYATRISVTLSQKTE